jgi:hypothetical protein
VFNLAISIIAASVSVLLVMLGACTIILLFISVPAFGYLLIRAAVRRYIRAVDNGTNSS